MLTLSPCSLDQSYVELMTLRRLCGPISPVVREAGAGIEKDICIIDFDDIVTTANITATFTFFHRLRSSRWSGVAPAYMPYSPLLPSPLRTRADVIRYAESRAGHLSKRPVHLT